MSDRVTVLRDGRNVGTKASADVEVDELISMMTGKPPGSLFPDHTPRPPDARVPRLEVLREDKDTGVRMTLAYLAGRHEPFVAVSRRHADVDDRDIRFVLADEA